MTIFSSQSNDVETFFIFEYYRELDVSFESQYILIAVRKGFQYSILHNGTIMSIKFNSDLIPLLVIFCKGVSFHKN